MGYEVKLEIFEGPLDLLLYLIKKNEIDIYDIPIALITEQYLSHIKMMKSLNLDVAGEYLVLAATLVHIKSKMLLPAQEEDTNGQEEEADPRSELVKQLLEYQVFKEAAMQLDQRPLLERDVFKRGRTDEDQYADGGKDEVDAELSVFELIEAFYRIISTSEKTEFMEIDVEKMSLTERINEILDRLNEKKKMTFTELIGGQTSRKSILYTFLAILELMRLRMIRVYQAGSFGVIRVALFMEK
ncbi:MAG TPA: segregation/condensation protein A [Syntrophaceae bacterium]|jgi:segregation and condensation protein A|nr:segregation/condensation protein A [Syntrophaceae bacterium]